MAGLSIYGLTDPRTNQVRYVGATTRSAYVRFREHKSHANARIPLMGEWIEELQRVGLTPICVILQSDPPDGLAAEGRWIAILRESGSDLFNVADGGSQGPKGYRHTEGWRAANSARMTGRIVSEQTRERIAAAKTGKPRPDLAERNRKSARLSAEQRLEIRRRANAGEKGVRLAEEFGVCTAVVSVIKNSHP